MWAAAAVAVASWMNSEEARRASQAERDRMQNLLDNLKSPNFDTSKIDAPTFQVLQRYVPQVSDYVQEKDPRFVELSDNAKQGESAQMAALKHLQQVGSAEGDIASDVAVNKANREAAISNQGMQGAILQNAEARGVGGSGLELGAALNAQQGAAERGALSSEEEAAQGYKNRLGAIMESGQLGGQIEDRATSQAKTNADILNNFNMRTAAGQNAYNQMKDAQQNQAQMYNINTAQNIADQNKQGAYNAAVGNRQNANTANQQSFADAMSKITGQQAQSNYNQNAITENTKDKNNTYQGLGNAYTSYQTAQDQKEQNEKDRQAYGNNKQGSNTNYLAS